MATPFQPDSTVPHARLPHALDAASVQQFIDELVGDDLHAKRVLSLANGVLGVLHAASLAIHAIGEALAAHRDLVPKHAIKVTVQAPTPRLRARARGGRRDFGRRRCSRRRTRGGVDPVVGASLAR